RDRTRHNEPLLDEDRAEWKRAGRLHAQHRQASRVAARLPLVESIWQQRIDGKLARDERSTRSCDNSHRSKEREADHFVEQTRADVRVPLRLARRHFAEIESDDSFSRAANRAQE